MTVRNPHLDWGDCVNVRDLGGHPLEMGGVTRRGSVVRADALDRLTSRGWDALFDHGVGAVLDLRTTDERAPSRLPAGLDEYHVPLFEDADADELFAADGMEDLYSRMLEVRAGAFADAVAAVAEAGSAGIVVHCQVGKDLDRARMRVPARSRGRRGGRHRRGLRGQWGPGQASRRGVDRGCLRAGRACSPGVALER